MWKIKFRQLFKEINQNYFIKKNIKRSAGKGQNYHF